MKARDGRQGYVVPVTIDYSTLRMGEAQNEEECDSE